MYRAILISDLHMSLGPTCNVEDFFADESLVALLDDPLLHAEGGSRVDLVLLGDAFDLWQTALQDVEYTADDSRQVSLDYTPESEALRLERVEEAHRGVFRALARFVKRPGCRLTLVEGNHDHSLVEAGVVQKKVRGLFGDAVRIVPHFDEPALALYAEHGNQWDQNNGYASFQHFGWKEECDGYFFVRLFWNRLETLAPDVDELPHTWNRVWPYILPIIRRSPKILGQAIRFWAQYRRDERVPHPIAVFAPAGAGALGDACGPDLLMTPRGFGGHVFSIDAEVERALREAYHAEPEVRKAIDEVRPAKAFPVPHPDAPVGAEAPAFALRSSKLDGQEGAEKLFTQNPTGKTSPLDPQTYRHIVFGHTHQAGKSRLSNGAWYVNSGCWTGRHTPCLSVVVAEKDDGPSRVGLGEFAAGRLRVDLRE